MGGKVLKDWWNQIGTKSLFEMSQKKKVQKGTNMNSKKRIVQEGPDPSKASLQKKKPADGKKDLKKKRNRRVKRCRSFVCNGEKSGNKMKKKNKNDSMLIGNNPTVTRKLKTAR